MIPEKKQLRNQNIKIKSKHRSAAVAYRFGQAV